MGCGSAIWPLASTVSKSNSTSSSAATSLIVSLARREPRQVTLPNQRDNDPSTFCFSPRPELSSRWTRERLEKDRRTSTPSKIRKVGFRLQPRGIEFPWIWIQRRVEVDAGKWVHHERACRYHFAVDIRRWADIPSHCNVRLSYAERFTDEQVKDGCLTLPRAEGDRG
jgi:hypothetical protein